MEALGIFGMIFAMVALDRISKLEQQVTALKKQLEDAGVIGKAV